jgi:hypothetical protein
VDVDEAGQEPHTRLLETAWGLIANAGWDTGTGQADLPKTPGWLEAALRWRDDYHRWLDAHLRPSGYQTWEHLANGLVRERDALLVQVVQLRTALRNAAIARPVAHEVVDKAAEPGITDAELDREMTGPAGYIPGGVLPDLAMQMLMLAGPTPFRNPAAGGRCYRIGAGQVHIKPGCRCRT